MKLLCNLLLLVTCANAATVEYTWVVQEWVVDYLRPTIDGGNTGVKRQSPFAMPDEQRSMHYLINGQHPGPAIECNLNDTVVIHVVNNMISEGVTIHWHGIHMPGTPFFDGSRGVTQNAIDAGSNMTYTWKAWPEGTHYYHSHMDSVQSARGIRGPIVVKNPEDPFKDMYDEEMTVVMADEWKDPGVCLKLEGAMPGNDVCADIRHGSFNGQYGNGQGKYPYPLIEVEDGKCYRMRFVMIGSNTENFVMTLAGHNMTLLALDGTAVKPILVSSFNLHLGERVDVVVCANQPSGAYHMQARYDYACTLTKGHFIPPGFTAVPECEFHAFMKYKSAWKVPSGWPPKGTGGGANPAPVSGVKFDLTNRKGWNMTQPLEPQHTPSEPDASFTINMGLTGPVYDGPTDAPMTKGKWYMDFDENRNKTNPPRSWSNPKVPLYKSKGAYGHGDIPIINIPETPGRPTEVEIVLNNLSPAAHMIHLHGMRFRVVNFADFEWCSINRTACFVMPYMINPCPVHDRKVSDPNNKGIEFGGYWGCAYNKTTDQPKQNLATPLVKDMIQVWQRSWAVIRIQAWNPGYWFFHCHMEQHIPLGMQTVLNVLPSQQPPMPSDIPVGEHNHPDQDMHCEMVSKENWELKQKVKKYEEELMKSEPKNSETKRN